MQIRSRNTALPTLQDQANLLKPASFIPHYVSCTANVSAIPNSLQPWSSPNISMPLPTRQPLLWCSFPLLLTLPLPGRLLVISQTWPRALCPQESLPLTCPILGWIRYLSSMLSKHPELASVTALVLPWLSSLFICSYPSLDCELPKGKDSALFKIVSTALLPCLAHHKISMNVWWVSYFLAITCC